MSWIIFRQDDKKAAKLHKIIIKLRFKIVDYTIIKQVIDVMSKIKNK